VKVPKTRSARVVAKSLCNVPYCMIFLPYARVVKAVHLNIDHLILANFIGANYFVDGVRLKEKALCFALKCMKHCNVIIIVRGCNCDLVV